MRIRNLVLMQLLLITCFFMLPGTAAANSGGSPASVSGTVLDPSGGVVANATVEIHNPVSEYDSKTTTDSSGNFSFTNIPYNPYHLTVSVPGFAPYVQDIEVRSSVPLDLKISLRLAGTTNTVTVESGAGDLLENDPTTHTDLDRTLFDKLPLESASSSVSSLVTLGSPGVAADSNGLFHGLGDHAENSFSVDGQPITDQQSKIFSNQIPIDSIQSLEVIEGAPPAEYGDKTSLVINVTTRSGQGVTTPHGGVTASYGTFGTSNLGFNLAYGGEKWGNFIAANGLESGRFLDPPEFAVMHDKGNEENLFDRVDYQFSTANSVHMNFGYTRSWFQNPNSFDNLNPGLTEGSLFSDPTNTTLIGAADQRSEIQTLNFAPSWTHLLSSNAVLTLGAFVRKDHYNYYPSNNPLADLGPANLQRETLSQGRTLNNAGIRSDLSYVKGVHNIKVGVTYEQTFLTENFQLGIVDPTLNAPCLTLNTAANPDVPVPGFTALSQCGPAGYQQNVASNPYAPGSASYPYFTTDLLPYDLTRGGGLYPFYGHTDVKELALYVQDAINKGNWSFNLGVRGDLYNGLTIARQAEPRLGVAYNIKQSNTVLNISYARTLETPFNENLVVSSIGCQFQVIQDLVPCVPAALSPGFRNEFHAGLQQAFGKYLVIDGEYIWKYTHNGYDFSDLGNTPIFFPVEWHNSKIPGYAVRASVPNFHGLTALVVFSSVAARFFPPQVGGLGVTVGQSGLPFRIDHDEKFNQTTHLQYQFRQRGPWIGFNWRYDSGLVAGAVPFAADTTTPVNLTGLSADQQMEAGLFCGNVFPTLTSPLTTCAPSQYGSTRITIPAPGTENDDHNPPRIAPRSLFDVAVGDDNLFHGEKYKWSARLTVINITNKVALYNFLSTFSGTHFVTPRAITGEIGFHF